MRRQMPSGSQTLFPALGQGRRWQQFESDRDSGTKGTAEEEHVLVSDCECANHHNNLSGTCVVAAVDTRMVPWNQHQSQKQTFFIIQRSKIAFSEKLPYKKVMRTKY